MKTCPVCANKVRDEAKFCKYCRHAFPLDQTAPVTNESVPASGFNRRETAPVETLASRLEYIAECRRCGRTADHREAVVTAVSIDSSDTHDLYALCRELGALGEYEMLASVCRRIIAIDPRHQALLPLAAALDKLGQKAEALLVYRKVLEVWPSNVRALYEVAAGIFGNGLAAADPDGSFVLEAMTAAIANPDDFSAQEIAGARIRAASLMIGRGELDDGMQLLADLPEKSVPAEDHTILGSTLAAAAQSFVSAGKPDLAVKFFRKSLRFWRDSTIQSHLTVLLADEARKLLNAGDPDAAYEMAVRAEGGAESIDTRKIAVEAMIAKCDMARQQGDNRTADECIDNGLELCPEDETVLKSQLETRRKMFAHETNVRRIKVFSILGGIAGVLAVTILLVHMAHGSLTVTVPHATNMYIMKGTKAVADSTTGRIEFPRTATDGLPWSGKYRVQAWTDKGGFDKLETEVTVPFWRKHKSIDLTMTVQKGHLNINTVPPGAIVKMTNDFQEMTCATPCTLQDVMTVRSTLEYSLSSLPHEKREFTARKDVVTDVEPVVFPAYLRIVSDPPGADVWIDDAPTGSVTPASISVQENGRHSISGSLPGYLVEGSDVTTHHGLPMDVRLQMTPLYGTLTIKSVYEDGTPCFGDVTIGDVTDKSWRRVKVLAKTHYITVNCRLGSSGTTETAIHKKNVDVPISVPSAEGAVRDSLIASFNNQYWYPVSQSFDQPTLMTWEQADSWCRTLRAGHLVGWRLPTVTELATLLEKGESKVRSSDLFVDWLLYSFISGIKSWTNVPHWTADYESATGGEPFVNRFTVTALEQEDGNYYGANGTVQIPTSVDWSSPDYMPPNGLTFCVRDL